MIRIVADTNILVSATIAKGNQYELLKKAKLGSFRLVISPQIITELKGVISRPKFGFSNEQVEDVLKQILSISEVVITTSKIDAVKNDPPDNRIIEAAIDGKASCIVSGDKDLLRLKKFKEIKIVTTRKFLEKFR